MSMTLIGATLHADDLLIPSITLEDYTARAIEQGIQGKQNQLSFESAGYSRTIAFRQTDSPTFSAQHTHTRGETNTNGFNTLSDTKKSSLALTESTPLGTSFSATSDYGDAAKPNVSLSLTQPLYIFVRNASLRTRKQADLRFGNAKDVLDATVLSLRARARSLYYIVMLAEETIRVEERKAQSSEKLLLVTQALVEAGKLAPVETMRARIRAQTDKRQLEIAVASRDKAVLSAKNFVFLPLDQPAHFTTKLQFKPLEVAVEKLTNYALAQRPALRSLRRNVELSRLDVQTAKETARPTLSLNTTYDYSELSPAYTSHGWTFGGTANWLFFDSGVTHDRVRVARISETVSALNLKDGERDTIVNVRNTYRDLKRTEKQILEFQNQREQARQNVEVLRLRFRNGLERLIDVFDAETQMRSLENEYLNLVVLFNQSKDTLSEYVGMDVENVR